MFGELASVSRSSVLFPINFNLSSHRLSNRLKHLFGILLCFGRLSVVGLKQHTALSHKLITHGLAVLVRHQLVLWYTSDTRSTTYEANMEVSYSLARTGEYTRIVEERYNPRTGSVISKILTLGHARVSDIVHVCIQDQADGHNESPKNTSALKGPNSDIHAPPRTREATHEVLSQLLQDGIILRTDVSHFHSPADNRVHVIKTTKDVAEFPGRTKKEREKQWEQAIAEKLEKLKYGSEVDIQRTICSGESKGKKRQRDNVEPSQARKRQRFSSPSMLRDTSPVSPAHESQTGMLSLLEVFNPIHLYLCQEADFLIGEYGPPSQS